MISQAFFYPLLWFGKLTTPHRRGGFLSPEKTGSYNKRLEKGGIRLAEILQEIVAYFGVFCNRN